MLEELATNPASSARRRIQHRKSASDTFAWAASALLSEFAAPTEPLAPIGADAPAPPTQHGLTGADRSTINGAAAHHHATAGGVDLGAPFGSIQAEDLLDILQGVEEDELDLDMDDLGVGLDGEGAEGEHGLLPPAALEAGRGGNGAATAGASAASSATPGFAMLPGSAPASAVAADATIHSDRHQPQSQRQQQQLTTATQQQQQQQMDCALVLHRRAVSCTMGGSTGAAAAAAASGGGGGVDGSRRGQSASSMSGAPPPRSLSSLHVRNPSDSLLSVPPAPPPPPPPPLVVDKPLSDFAGQTRANALDPSQLDPKRAKRIIANRQSAHRSRMKKLQVIHELEQQVAAARAAAEAVRQQVAAAAAARRELLLAAAEAHCGLAALRREVTAAEAEQAALVSELRSLGVAVQALPPPPPPDAAAAGAGGSGAGSSPTLGGGGPGLPLAADLAVGPPAAAAAAAAMTAAMSHSSSRPPMQSLMGPASFSDGGAAAPGAPALPLSGLPPLALPLPPPHPDGPEHRPRLSGPGLAPGSMAGGGGGDGGGSVLVPEPTLSPAPGTRCSSGGGSSASLAAGPGGGALGQPLHQPSQLLPRSVDAGQALLQGPSPGVLFSNGAAAPHALTGASLPFLSEAAFAAATAAATAVPAATTSGGAPAASSMAAQSQQPQHSAAPAPACGPFAFSQPGAAPPVSLAAGPVEGLQQLTQQQQGLPAQPGRRHPPRHSVHRRYLSAGCAVDLASWNMSAGIGVDGRQGLLTSGALALAPGGACPPMLAACSGGGGAAAASAAAGPAGGDTEMALAGLATSHGDPLIVGHPSLRVRLSSTSAHALSAVDAAAATAAAAASASAGASAGAAVGSWAGAGCGGRSFSKPGLSGQDAAAAAAEAEIKGAGGAGAGVDADGDGGDGSPMALDEEGEALVGADGGLLMADVEEFLVKEEPQLAGSGSTGTLRSMMSSGA